MTVLQSEDLPSIQDEPIKSLSFGAPNQEHFGSAQNSSPWAALVESLGVTAELHKGAEYGGLHLNPNARLTFEQINSRRLIVEGQEIESISDDVRALEEKFPDEGTEVSEEAIGLLWEKKIRLLSERAESRSEINQSLLSKVVGPFSGIAEAVKLRILSGKLGRNGDELLSRLQKSGNTATLINEQSQLITKIFEEVGGYEGFIACENVLHQFGSDVIDLFYGNNFGTLSDQSQQDLKQVLELAKHDVAEIQTLLQKILKVEPNFLRTFSTPRIINDLGKMIVDPTYTTEYLELLRMQSQKENEEIHKILYKGKADVTNLRGQIDSRTHSIAARQLSPVLGEMAHSKYSHMVTPIAELTDWDISGISMNYIQVEGESSVLANIQRLHTILADEERCLTLFTLYHAISATEVDTTYHFDTLISIVDYIQGDPEQILRRLISDGHVEQAAKFYQALPKIFIEEGCAMMERSTKQLVDSGVICKEIGDIFENLQAADGISSEQKTYLYSFMSEFFSKEQTQEIDLLHNFVHTNRNEIGRLLTTSPDGNTYFDKSMALELLNFCKLRFRNEGIKKPIEEILKRTNFGDQANLVELDQRIRSCIESNWFVKLNEHEAAQIVVRTMLQTRNINDILTPDGKFTPVYLNEFFEQNHEDTTTYLQLFANVDTSQFGNEGEVQLSSDLVDFLEDIDISQMTRFTSTAILDLYENKKEKNDFHLSAEEIFGVIVSKKTHLNDEYGVFESYADNHPMDQRESIRLYILKQLTHRLLPSEGYVSHNEFNFELIAPIIYSLDDSELESAVYEDGRISSAVIEKIILEEQMFCPALAKIFPKTVFDSEKAPMLSIFASIVESEEFQRTSPQLLAYLIEGQHIWINQDGSISGKGLADLAKQKDCTPELFFKLSEMATDGQGKDQMLKNLEKIREEVSQDELLFELYKGFVNDSDAREYVDGSGRFTEEFIKKCIKQEEYLAILVVVEGKKLIELPPQSKYATILNQLKNFEGHHGDIIQHAMLIGLDDENVTQEHFNEKFLTAMRIVEHIARSPSRELRRIGQSLVTSLLSRPDPVAEFEKIESIFVKNNLPYVGKLFLTFEALFPDGKFESVLRQNPHLSPILLQLGVEGKQVIFRDLLNIHIEGGNRSLEQYLQVFHTVQPLLQKIDVEGFDLLGVDEISQFDVFINKAQMMVESSMESRISKASSRQEKLSMMRNSIGVRRGQSIPDRLVEIYARPLGFTSVDDVLKRIRDARTEADLHARNVVENRSTLQFQSGDLVKGAQSKFIGSMLQDGCIAKEFLGADFENSDGTPFDTDTSRIESLSDDFNKNLSQTSYGSYGGGYGDFGIVFRERKPGLFQNSTLNPPSLTHSSRRKIFSGRPSYEIFESKVVGKNHLGIRTGIPFTEAAFLIVNDNLLHNVDRLGEIFFQVAKNGYYIPITDLQGKIVFTPEQYDEYRSLFRGTELYSNESYELKGNTSGKTIEAVDEVEEQLISERPIQKAIISSIQNDVSDIFDRLQILKQTKSSGISGAALNDTGSTSRGTSTPGNADFDFVIELDDIQFEDGKTVQALKEELSRQYPGEKSEIRRGDGSILHEIQTSVQGVAVDLDISIIKRASGSSESTEKMLSAIYSSIEKEYGLDALMKIRATIAFTKKLLKENNVYKASGGALGGIGGIGVEYWILQHGGSFDEARRSFLNAASGENGNLVDFNTFKSRYHIWDVGYNLLNGKNENLIEKKVNEGTYRRMVEVLQQYES